MKFTEWRGNSIRVVLGSVAILCGCSAPVIDKDNALLAIFVETKSEDPDVARQVEWFRSDPRTAWLENKPVFQPLHHMEKAELIQTEDGIPAIRLTFNQRGKRLLKNVTTLRSGRRLFMMAWYRQNPEDKEMKPRCIGVRFIERSNDTGQFVFLPDTTKDEAKQLVDGFNNLAKKIQR
jgi:hypothetical protein